MNNARIAAIFKRLSKITELTEDMTVAGAANAGNPTFDRLMAEHKQLTDEVSEILGEEKKS